MWLNTTSQSAIRAVLYVADHQARGPVRVDDVAAALNTPRNYLSKTLYALVQARVLRSTRGPGGGFQLASSPDHLVLRQIIAPFEPVTARRCLIGIPECGRSQPCLAHRHWEKIAGAVSQFFDQTTVAELIAGGDGSLSLAPTPPVRRRRRRAGSAS